MSNPNEIHDAVLNGQSRRAVAAVEIALESGADPEALVNDQMIPAMAAVGDLFETGEYFLPELLVSARAMKDAMELIKPLLSETNAEKIGRIIIGTVQGDIHDIGKNLVGIMLEGAGFSVVDLGVDVAPEAFVQAAKEEGIKIVFLSALLSTTMPAMARTIDAFRSEGLRDRVKIFVGGAPVNEDFCTMIGADGFGNSTNTAVQFAQESVASG